MPLSAAFALLLAVAPVLGYPGAPLWQDADGIIRKGSKTYDNWDAFHEADHTPEHKCGTEADHKGNETHHHHHHERALLASDCSDGFNNPSTNYAPSTGVLYKVQTVVHVLTNGAGTTAPGYLSAACIQAGIDLLNQDFRVSAGSKGAAAGSVDTRIEFELATTTTSGGATTGIVYHNNAAWFNVASGSGATQTAMFAAFYADFPKAQYLNIVTKLAVAADGDSLLGYAKFPTDSATSDVDGVVVAYEAWGPATASNGDTCATTANFDQGATATHEVGHYLGLYHTFQDGGAGNIGGGCGSAVTPHCHHTGDLICDTPPELDAIYNCVDANSCGDPDPIENFMGYSYDSCLTSFTEEQARRMRCSLTSYRSGIYTSTSTLPNPPYPPVPLSGSWASPPPPLEATTYPCHCRCGPWTFSGVTISGACGNPDNDPYSPWCFTTSGVGCTLSDGTASTQPWMYCNAANYPEPFCISPPASPSPPPPAVVPGCINDCGTDANWSLDGICDDGGPGSQWASCPVGYDCEDCGHRLTPPSPPQSPSPPPPSPSPPSAVQQQLPPPPSSSSSVPGCANDCGFNANWSLDGICDDGGPGSEYASVEKTAQVVCELIASGDPSDYGAAEEAAIASQFAAVANVPAQDVSVAIASASVKITVTIATEDVDAGQAVKANLATVLSDATAATTFLQAAVPGATVEAAPTVSEPALIPEGDDGSGMVVVVAAAGGGVGALVILGLAFYYLRKAPGSAKKQPEKDQQRV